jgi:site-specific DNA-methyltransferase (adenine-specific)
MYKILQGDCLASLKTLSDASVNACITSPPYYGLRDYGVEGQAGLEATPEEYVANMVKVFREVKRCLKDDGTLWLNIGDSYAGSGKGQWNGGSADPKNPKTQGMPLEIQRPATLGLKSKDLIGIPWMLAFALRADGWYLRQDIIWHKPNPMPESVKDRCTKAHEYIFLLSKSQKYYYDADAIAEPAKWERWGDQTENKKSQGNAGRLGGKTIAELPIKDTKNKRSVWTVIPKNYKGAHFAVFPPELIEPCVLASCPENGVIIDPFGGSGTTAGVAIKHGRKSVLCELNPEYCAIMPSRIKAISGYDMEDDFI